MSDNKKEILSLKEVADYMGVSPSTIYKLTSARKIPYFKPGGKLVYFNRDEILTWLQSNPVATDENLTQRALNH